jgi:hypothetical protein
MSVILSVAKDLLFAHLKTKAGCPRFRAARFGVPDEARLVGVIVRR